MLDRSDRFCWVFTQKPFSTVDNDSPKNNMLKNPTFVVAFPSVDTIIHTSVQMMPVRKQPNIN